MRYIALINGQSILMDDGIYDKQYMHTWRISRYGYVIRSEYQSIGTPRTIYLHRLVAGVTDPKIIVRHIDGDKLNNQKHNLEVVG